jgi:3-ketoacyl-CoA synthase
MPYATFVESLRQITHFLTRLLERSGLGEETYMPAASHYIQPERYCTLEAAREESELAIFSAIDELFSKTSVNPRTIDVLVANCSGFSPTPGLPDMIVHRYKMRSDIRSIHLSGMGCSAGLISIELAKAFCRPCPKVQEH